MPDQPLKFFAEPALAFGTGQRLESPKDGLFMFGPLVPEVSPGDVRYGVVGTEAGLRLFRDWIRQVRSFIPGMASDSAQHRPFPGFAEVFGVGLPESPVASLVVKDEEIDHALLIADRHLAVYRTVDVYASRISRYMSEEERAVSIWFVVVPERIYTFGRPQSVVPLQLRRESGVLVDFKMARTIAKTPSLFEADNIAAEPYRYEVNFHNQLKARLLEGPNRAVVQVVRETAIAPDTFLKSDGKPIRRVQDAATIAWNLCTRPTSRRSVGPGSWGACERACATWGWFSRSSSTRCRKGRRVAERRCFSTRVMALCSRGLSARGARRKRMNITLRERARPS